MSGRLGTRAIASMALVLLGGWSLAGAGEWSNPKANVPPRAKPQRRSAAESLPPLPLPATPLRRSERKRPPAPPALAGMINFSESHFRMVDGERRRESVFPTTQIDIERLIWFANRRLNLRYRYIRVSPAQFSWDPTELPLLYLTGWTPIPKMSDEMLGRLRRYLYDGGTLVVHAQCGREEFRRTARTRIAEIFPKRRLAPLDTDSPLFRAHFPLKEMRVREGEQPFRSMPPYLEAVYLGCRPAIIYSPIDLNCGWDVATRPIPGGTLYHQEDALKLGVNLVTTVLANFEYARAWGVAKVYPEQKEQTRDQLVVAQVAHEGDWDPTPHALPNLMKYIQDQTTLNVQFKREVVALEDVDVFEHPVLYMTGLRDFKFSETQIARLRTYLSGGGVLIADSAAGRAAFDRAFRRELRKVLPESKLAPLESDCPLYQMPYRIGAVDYSEMVKVASPSLNAPTLEGARIDGQLAVIYSPVSLGNGWERLPFAYSRGYQSDDALRLGVNLIAYALTH
jgi:uncharacterized protein DUF4159